MAEWEHKEAHWKLPEQSGSSITQWVNEENQAVYITKQFPQKQIPRKNGYPKISDEERNQLTEQNVKQAEAEREWKSRAITFVEFLDLQCTGGWEVFKVSRNFNSPMQETWCIFRRLV